ncbi:MAG: carbamoyl-phosphate synthase L chain, ATP binding domain-containing protein [Benjaminiella poitrasii]|nr:MAG: carbamoyl-phosphate synthase L chain, ATP binding domain-containing protein [Benjaminiella poitrasii]
MLHKILVANRGEIAIRVIAAATELGILTVAVYSEEQDQSHCQLANEVVRLQNTLCFLDPKAIIDAAKSVNATAIHPGYGFLSESIELANQCKKAGIIFIGPSPDCIAAVGDKVSARQVAQSIDVPIIPGTFNSISHPEQVYNFANQFGYPVMLKARDGGGGRGIRLVHSRADVPDALERVLNESPSHQVFIEKAMVGENVKHIEVQVLGDTHGNIIHLFERDCSIQRRYQKIIELAPCLCLPTELRKEICEAAVRLAQHVGYDSAGTVEFLVVDNAKFYFMEVNPRIQVEHTISEQITQIDLVQAQIRIALFRETLLELGLVQLNFNNNNLVSIQARIVAENPLKGHALSVGKIVRVQFPQGHGVRVDTWIHPQCIVLPSFDSLLAKIIVTGQSYEDALSKLTRALRSTHIEGIETNIQFLIALLSDKSFFANQFSQVHIHSLENSMDRIIQAMKQYKPLISYTNDAKTATDTVSSNVQFKPGDAFNLQLDDSTTYSFQIESISTNNFPHDFSANIQTTFSKQPITVRLNRKSGGGGLHRKINPRVQTEIGSPITGKLVEINVKQGDIVAVGQALFVISAMKMETVVKSSRAGTVKEITAVENDLIEEGDLIIEFKKDESKL